MKSFAKSKPISFVSLALVLCLTGCASTRVLSKEEQDRMGLHGVIYDAKICNSYFDPKTNRHQIDKDCEWVTCEREKGKIVCRASKKPESDQMR